MSQAPDASRETNIIRLADFRRLAESGHDDPPPRPAAAARKPVPPLNIEAVGRRATAPPRVFAA